MARDVITIKGQDVVVREDTAKAYRFVRWGIITAVLCLSLMVVLFIGLFWKLASDGNIEGPAQMENSSRR